jgi:hypothetical protein
MLGLLDILAIKVPFYFVADAYYAAGKMLKPAEFEKFIAVETEKWAKAVKFSGAKVD